MINNKFTAEDIGKFIVISRPYEQKIMYGGGLFGTQLKINDRELNRNDMLFGVYEILYHAWCEESKNVSYKIYLDHFLNQNILRYFYYVQINNDLNLV